MAQPVEMGTTVSWRGEAAVAATLQLSVCGRRRVSHMLGVGMNHSGPRYSNLCELCASLDKFKAYPRWGPRNAGWWCGVLGYDVSRRSVVVDQNRDTPSLATFASCVGLRSTQFHVKPFGPPDLLVVWDLLAYTHFRDCERGTSSKLNLPMVYFSWFSRECHTETAVSQEA